MPEQETVEFRPIIHGNLSPEIVRECENVQDYVRDIRLKVKSGIPVPPADFFLFCEYLQSFRFWISNQVLEAEALYKDRLHSYVTESKSVAAAEIKAEVTEEYRAYRYLKRIDELTEEQVLLLKKFGDKFDRESH